MIPLPLLSLKPVSDCQPLSVPTHGSISTSVLSQGTVVFVTCDTGYTLFGANIIECLTIADWNNAEPTCELGNKLTSIKNTSSTMLHNLAKRYETNEFCIFLNLTFSLMVQHKPNLVRVSTFLKTCVGAPFLKLHPDVTIQTFLV